MNFIFLMLKVMWNDRNYSIFWAFRNQIAIVILGVILWNYFVW